MGSTSATCPACSNQFSYPRETGRPRLYCRDRECYNRRKGMATKERMVQRPPCAAPGCKRKANRKVYCEACYYQLRRTGSLERIPRKYKNVTGNGYVRLLAPTHPLAGSQGWVFEHRAVLYAVRGEGPHACFWCDTSLTWPAAVVDHLNEDKQDNRSENLVISCNNCNRARGAVLPFIKRMRPEVLAVFFDTATKYHLASNG